MSDDKRLPSGTERVGYGNGIQSGYDELVRPAEASIRVYSPADAIGLVDDPGVRFVDVRDKIELYGGVIAGAIHVSRDQLETHLDPDSPQYANELDDAAEIVFYCASGARSALAVPRAKELDYDRVGHLDGGISAWKDAGGPIQEIEAGWW